MRKRVELLRHDNDHVVARASETGRDRNVREHMAPVGHRAHHDLRHDQPALSWPTALNAPTQPLIPNATQAGWARQTESAAGARRVVVVGDQFVWTAGVEKPVGTVER